jgi:hypothetical protein
MINKKIEDDFFFLLLFLWCVVPSFDPILCPILCLLQSYYLLVYLLKNIVSPLFLLFIVDLRITRAGGGVAVKEEFFYFATRGPIIHHPSTPSR